MDLKRVVEGPVVAVLFLIFFVCAIFGVRGVFNKLALSPTSNEFSASVSGVVSEGGEIFNGVNAESAISIESNLSDVNKIIFEKASDKQLPIASLTKLMTAIVVLDNYNLSDTAVADGHVLSVENFLYIMLVGSSNKAAYALSELVGSQKFVELMNKKAKDLGMENTFFADPTGLSPQNVSTANDLARLAIHILKDYPKIAEMSRVKELYVPRFGNVVNTDELLDEIPNVICSKTGFTEQAQGCLLLVVSNPKNSNYLINVILGADDRFSEMQKLINQTCQ